MWVEDGHVIVRTVFANTPSDSILKQFCTGDPCSSLAMLGYNHDANSHPWEPPPGLDGEGSHPALRLLLTSSCGELIVKTYYKEVHNVEVLDLYRDFTCKSEYGNPAGCEFDSENWFITFALLPINEDRYFHRVSDGKKRKYKDALQNGLDYLPWLANGGAPLPDVGVLREICLLLMLSPSRLPFCEARRVVSFLPSREWLLRQALR